MSEAERIRDFLIDELHWQGSRAELTDDLPLISNRVIDSMGLLSLVAWLESTYGIEIADEEVVPATFGTIKGIERMLEAKQQRHREP